MRTAVFGWAISVVFLAAAPALAQTDAGFDAAVPNTSSSSSSSSSTGGAATTSGSPVQTGDENPGVGTTFSASGSPSGDLQDPGTVDKGGCATSPGSSASFALPIAIGLLFAMRKRRQPTNEPSARKRS